MARLPRVKLRVKALLKERGMTPYALAKASGEAISLSGAYRLARDTWDQLPRETIVVLCDIFECKPGDLFEYAPKSSSLR